MKVAITQSNYLPWKGYFEIIKFVDEFIFLDEVQFTRRDWRNRNLIRNAEKKVWITLPVKSKGNYKEIISKIQVSNNNWRSSHLKIIESHYSKSEYFEETYKFVKNCFDKLDTNNLSDINKFLIIEISRYLGFKTKFLDSKTIKINSTNDPSQRIFEIANARKAKIYVTGPAAKNYLNENKFTNNSINVEWFDYKDTKVYNQSYQYFIPNLSIIDCMMNCGKYTELYLN